MSADEGGGAPKGEEFGFEGALRLFTIGNAQCGYEDRDKGSIAVGQLGDLAVLSGDPTTLAPKDLFNLKVDATILGGDVVFPAIGGVIVIGARTPILLLFVTTTGSTSRKAGAWPHRFAIRGEIVASVGISAPLSAWADARRG